MRKPPSNRDHSIPPASKRDQTRLTQSPTPKCCFSDLKTGVVTTGVYSAILASSIVEPGIICGNKECLVISFQPR